MIAPRAWPGLPAVPVLFESTARSRRHPGFIVRCAALLAIAMAPFTLASLPATAVAATVESRVAASTDDAEEAASGSMYLTSSDLELVFDTSNQTVGVRWTGLAIPAGATVSAAYIQFSADESHSEATSLTIRGQAADNAPTFGSTTGNLSTRPRTAAAASWSPVAWIAGEAGANQRTPDLSAVLQEIVNRAGWASGNALAMIITGTGHRTARSFNGSAAAAPLLHVEFTTGGASPPTARLSVTQLSSPALTVLADGSASTAGGSGAIASYRFDFGDGTAAVTTTAPTATAQHTYAAAGTYTVTLIVTDTGGNPSAPATATVTVTAAGGTGTTVEKRVTASTDDAEEAASGSVSLTSSDLELVFDTSNQAVGMRWTGLAIPQGATITAGYIQFSADEAQSEATSLTIRGQAADNAATFGSTAGNVSTRPRTAAAASWSPAAWVAGEAGANQRTPDLSAVVQEIVSRPGWASGNALAMIVTGTGHRTARSFNGSAAAAPLLHVEFTTGGASPPTARLSVMQLSSPALTVQADGSASTAGSAPIASYRFDFGDGTAAVTTTAPTATAQHTYAAAGTYTVTLVATDTDGRTSAPATASVNVVAASGPTAGLSVTQLSSPALTVRADGSASTAGSAGPIATYRFEFGDGTAAVTTTAPTATAQHTYPAAGTYSVTLVVTDTGGNSSAPATASISVTAATATTLEKRTAASADDAEEATSGSVSLNSSDLELVFDGGNPQTVGLRWTGLAIPPGAAINAAYIQFGADESQSEGTTLTIRGQAADNAATFGSTTGNVSTRPRTTAAASWSPVAWTAGQAGANQRTPDLSAVVQEIVNRPGWASGNALAMIINGSGHRTAWSFDGNSAGAPLLHVEFTGTGGGSSGPTARLSVTQLSSPALTVRADGSASTAGSAPIATYRFEFGDGTPAVTTTAPTATAQHTYAAAGTYTVRLVVTDTGGNSSAPATASVTVGGIKVYVGYYDTHHPDNTRPKPDPWKGSSGVVFVGKSDNSSGGWDSSALRIDNLTGASITGVVVTVDIGSSRFALWGTNSIPSGSKLILAQTGFENFDGSDTNPAGCFDCNPRDCLTKVQSTIPVVHVTYGGRTTNYYDSGQILNTHGVDAAGCPYTGGRNDESEVWQEITPQAPAGAQVAANDPARTEYVPAQPRVLTLGPASPNPAADVVTLRFVMPMRGPVRLAIYDVTGRLVKTSVDGVLEPGEYIDRISLNGVPAGVYYCSLSTPEQSLHQKFVHVR